MPSNVVQKIEWLTGQISMRRTWLATHGTSKRPWPETDRDMKQYGLDMMLDIKRDYELSLERSKASNAER